MDFATIVEEAYERAGVPVGNVLTGYQVRTARRSMNLLTLEWASRGLNMWTYEEGTVNLVQGTATYDLPNDTIDLLDQVIRTQAGEGGSQTDISCSRISVSTYSSLPNKLAQGRPLEIYIERLRETPQFTLWPVPDQGTEDDPYYQLVYWRLRRIQDAGNGQNTPDMNWRFFPALVAGLAYYLALKNPDLVSRVPMLQAEAERLYQLAAEEDREKAPVRFVPRSPWN
jgi:hypothetical protein